MTDAEYRRKILERTKELADEWHTPWGTDQVENYNELMSHTEDWDDLVTGGRDSSTVASDLSRSITTRKKEKDDIEEAMAELGFTIIGTGGGCEAYHYEVTTTNHWPHFLVTEDNAAVPRNWDEEVTIGYYPSEQDEGTWMHYTTMLELVALLQQGKGHPEWKGGTTGAAPSAGLESVSQDDLDVINRHRRGLGMGPVPQDAGWSAGELQEQAERIRTTGRMSNPGHERLKRKLMR